MSQILPFPQLLPHEPSIKWLHCFTRVFTAHHENAFQMPALSAKPWERWPAVDITISAAIDQGQQRVGQGSRQGWSQACHDLLILKDNTFCKAASSWRFQSMQWHSYINLTWMGTFLCWNSTLIQTTQVPSIASHCPCYCLQGTGNDNINNLWYTKICHFDVHIPAFAISGVCAGLIRIFALFRSLCVILFWCK